jgi:release factor glutamine methyltransferase
VRPHRGSPHNVAPSPTGQSPGSALAGTPVRDALDSAIIALAAAGVDTPRLDAEVLLAHALGVDRAALVMDPARPVAGEAARAFRDFVRRRAVAREPVAYIVGAKGFRHIELRVDRRALVPRPETELLVEVGLTLAPGARVHDACTGSGAVALALKHERPDLIVSGSDASAEAVALARENAARLGLDVQFAVADLLDAAGAADAVLANPPYVEDGARLAPELGHEPSSALLAGPDGLDVIRRLVAARRAPLLALEVGAGQARAVAAMLDGEVEVLRDLAGIERVVVARR